MLRCRPRSLCGLMQRRRGEDRSSATSGDKFFIRERIHLTRRTQLAKLSPCPCAAAQYGIMQSNVSIRNIATRTNGSKAGRFNSRARYVDDPQRVLPLWPRERDDRSLEGREKLIAALECALRRERRYGRAGHPAYDLERHASLSRMLKDERAALTELLSRVHQSRQRPQT